MQVGRHFDQREAVAGRQRQHDRVFGRRGLQFEVELAAEALAQRQAPRAVHARAEGRMQDELRAAGFVEEALQHDALLRRHGAERGDLAREVVGELARGGFVEADVVGEERHRVFARLDAFGQCGAQARDARREFVGAPRRFAQPERDARRHALRILDAQAAGFDAQDAVARVAELEDVAGQAFDREVFVDRADVGRLRFEHHGVIAGVRDRAAGHHRDLLAARAPAQALVDRIAMQVARAMAAARGEAFDEHLDDVVEGLARQLRHTARRCAPARTTRPRPIPARRLRRRVAARGHRTAPAACAAHRVRRGARSRARPRIRRGRRAIAGTGGPSARRRRSGPNGPRVAGRRRSRAANRAAPRDRHRRCRCPVPATRSRRALSTGRSSGVAPRPGAIPSRANRGARRRVPCRADRRDGARRARPCGAC